EAIGLLALMLLHDARRAARTSADGDLVLLAEQDRARWDRGQIAEGVALLERALAARRAGPFTLQAAIAAVHAEAPDAAATDWPQIAGLYDVLLRLDPSPIVRLNRAVAVAMRDGPAAGLALVDGLFAEGALHGHHLLHATRADLCRRLGRTADARAAYRATRSGRTGSGARAGPRGRQRQGWPHAAVRRSTRAPSAGSSRRSSTVGALGPSDSRPCGSSTKPARRPSPS
ncbi:MAG: hypothetical protein MUC69_01995, partial [Gemmatimonadales bacterium]|nr:hypothetical protein [Gemmatimonadales bacterium]